VGGWRIEGFDRVTAMREMPLHGLHVVLAYIKSDKGRKLYNEHGSLQYRR